MPSFQEFLNSHECKVVLNAYCKLTVFKLYEVNIVKLSGNYRGIYDHIVVTLY